MDVQKFLFDSFAIKWFQLNKAKNPISEDHIFRYKKAKSELDMLFRMQNNFNIEEISKHVNNQLKKIRIAKKTTRINERRYIRKLGIIAGLYAQEIFLLSNSGQTINQETIIQAKKKLQASDDCRRAYGCRKA